MKTLALGMLVGLLGLVVVGDLAPAVLAEETSVSALGSAQPAVMYVASRNAKKYHLPSCAFAKRISKASQVEFKSAEAAEQAGLSPCKVCLKAGKSAQTARANTQVGS